MFLVNTAQQAAGFGVSDDTRQCYDQYGNWWEAEVAKITDG